MKVKAGDDVMATLEAAYRANRPVLVEGPHGIGKSDLVKVAADRLGIDCTVRDLSLMEAPDLVGLPVQKNGRTHYAPPGFLPTGGKGFLVLEELNRAERYMMAPCLQLMTARCLNDYLLPDGWLPVATINPDSQGYDVRPLDPALRSRFIVIEVEADPARWLAWARMHGIHGAVQQYVAKVPDIFETTNPRSWTYVSDVLNAHKGSRTLGRNTLLPMISGLVGDLHARAFFRTYTEAHDAPIDADTILHNYRSVRAAIREWARARNTGELSGIAHAMQVALQSSVVCQEIGNSTKLKTNLETFIEDLPADLGKKVKAAAQTGGAL